MKAGDKALVPAQLGVQHLDGDRAADRLLLLGAVDGAEAAAADQRLDLFGHEDPAAQTIARAALIAWSIFGSPAISSRMR